MKYFFQRINYKKLDSRIFNDKTIITIGEKTSAELKKHGLTSDLTPRQYTAEGILRVLKSHNLKNKKFLIPRAKIARDILPDTLRKLKAKVTVVECYETVLPHVNPAFRKDIISKLKNNEIDLITFTSSSTFNNIIAMLKNDAKHLNNTLLSSIGPITSMTIKENGFIPGIQAKKHTVEGLIDAIIFNFKASDSKK